MQGKRFLIIDLDGPTLRRLEATILEPAGHTLTITKRVDKTPPGEFDMILLGDHSGGDLLEHIEPLQLSHPATPIVLFTQRNRTGKLSLQALEAGAIACLAIPIRIDEVMPAISRGLAVRRQLETWAGRRRPDDPGGALPRLPALEKATGLGQSLAAEPDPDRVLAAIVEAAVAVAGAEAGRLVLLSEGGAGLAVRSSFHFEQDTAQIVNTPVDDPPVRQVMATGEAVLLDGGAPGAVEGQRPVRSSILVPLVSAGQAIGVLGVDKGEQRREAFGRETVASLSVLAGFAAAAIENARRFAAAEAERNTIERTILSIADGVIVTDEAGRVLLINERAREIFALADGDHAGRPIGGVLETPTLAAAIADSSQTGVRRLEFEPREKCHYIAQVSPVPGAGKIVTVQDVTQFKEMEAVKNEFVTMVSHDLRSPLTAILGYVELVGRVGEVSRQQREFLQRIQLSVTSITDLINALLELGRIEADFDQNKELLPLPVILGYAADGYVHRFEEKGQALDIDIEGNLPFVFGSAIRLRQMMGNLLENASRYSPEGSRVTLQARAEGDQVILKVCDNGIGIPEQDLPHVFNKLYRGSNVPMDMLGTGLGLSIVRSIVANHGGRMWIDSEVGKGTVVTVVLPAVMV